MLYYNVLCIMYFVGSSRRRRRRQHCVPPVLLPRSQACTLQPVVGSNSVANEHHVLGMGMYETGTVMLLPPPYSPRQCIQYEPPTQGNIFTIPVILLLDFPHYFVQNEPPTQGNTFTIHVILL